MKRTAALALLLLLPACSRQAPQPGGAPRAGGAPAPFTATGTAADGRPVTIAGSVTVGEAPAPPPVPGPVVVVPAGASLQDALDRAKPGTTLVLTAGAAYIGPFTLPKKTGDGWITVQSSALAQLPAPGKRVSATHAPLMPRLLSPGQGMPALKTAPGSHHYRFVGIEFAQASATAVVFDLVTLGDGSAAQTSLALVPHHLAFDRCYLHGEPGGETKRGIPLNAGDTEITGCRLTEFKGAGYDTQALCGWNGPGPYRIANNHLEAAGEVIMFGGSDPAIKDLIPTGITITGNTITKPLSWKGGPWTIKNLLELKNARQVTIDGNEFSNNWAQAQVGFAVLFTAVNQNGTVPWCTVQDITFTNNRVHNSDGGLNIGPNTAQVIAPARIRVANNLFTAINGIFLQVAGTTDLTVSHNTVMQTGNLMTLYGAPCPGLRFLDNIALHGPYGVLGDGVGEGIAALTRYAPGAIFAGNVIVGRRDNTPYPPGNFNPDTVEQVGFTDLAGGDYRLGAGSPYQGKGTDGKDVGWLAVPGRKR